MEYQINQLQNLSVLIFKEQLLKNKTVFQLIQIIDTNFVTMANLLELTKEPLGINQIHHVYSNTNQTLYEFTDNESFIYYLPAYMQLTFNSISKIDYESLKSSVHCDIVFALNVCGLKQFMIDHLRSNIRFYFNNDTSIQLEVQEEGDDEEEQEDGGDDQPQPQIFIDEEKQYRKNQLVYHYLIFTVRKQFVTGMVADVDWTPFELLDLVLSVYPKLTKDLSLKQYIRSEKEKNNDIQLPNQIQQRRQYLISKKKPPLKNIRFYFNMMDCPKNKANTIYYQTNRQFGIYAVATNKLRAEYSNKSAPQIIIDKADQINKKLQETDLKVGVNHSKIQNFEAAHFIITIYKLPSSAVVTIFFPILLLCIINLGIFNQSKKLAGRIENLATIMLAFIAVFPVIRQQIPPNPKITRMEVLIYFLTGTDLLCLINSVLIRTNDQIPVQNILNSGFFLATLAISSLTVLIVIFLMLRHKFDWEPSYIGRSLQGYKPSERFEHFSWSNEKCDQHFMKFFDSGRIKAIQKAPNKLQ